MLSYETIVTILISEAERSGLSVQFSQEQYDPHTMMRTLNVTCFPAGVREPQITMPFATLSFTWEAALTAISVMGSESICALYHDPDEPCVHAEEGCAYNVEVDFEVVYEVPLFGPQQADIARAPVLAHTIQELVNQKNTENPVDVEVQLQFTSDYHTFISRLAAQQTWSVGDALHEESELRGELGTMCKDVTRILELLKHVDGTASSFLENFDPNDFDERTYLRPPTA